MSARRALGGLAAAVLFVVCAGLACGAPARAADAAIPLPDDPGCVRKVRGEICQMANGAGGVCGPSVCGVDRPCLRCVPPPKAPENAGSSLWMPMIAFGATVMIVGFLFWFRLKKLWGPGTDDPGPPPRAR